jgi:DnaJ-class molecular chaperone
MNPYHILELPIDASQNDIKKSYRRLALLYHPDKYRGSDEHFKKVNLAYQILSDFELKKDYDSKINYDEQPYDLIQSIISKNKLNIINSLFGYIYDDNDDLKNDINTFNFSNMYNNIKCKFNLNINNEISVNLKDIYLNNTIKLNIKRKINKKISNYILKINPDVYDEELFYENLGDEESFLKGNLIIKINLNYDSNLYQILDNYNLMITVNSFEYLLFNEINLKNLQMNEYHINSKFKIFIVKNYGFLNYDNNEKGDLFIKIII